MQTPPPNTVAPSDLALWKKAQEDLIKAQATAAFVNRHLMEVYQLMGSDAMDTTTGAILRESSEATHG